MTAPPSSLSSDLTVFAAAAGFFKIGLGFCFGATRVFCLGQLGFAAAGFFTTGIVAQETALRSQVKKVSDNSDSATFAQYSNQHMADLVARMQYVHTHALNTHGTHMLAHTRMSTHMLSHTHTHTHTHGTHACSHKQTCPHMHDHTRCRLVAGIAVVRTVAFASIANLVKSSRCIRAGALQRDAGRASMAGGR